MHRAALISLIIAFSLLNPGCSPSISPDEAKVLVILDEIQRGVDSDIDYTQFEKLLGTAKAEISTLELKSDKNPCFINAVSKCYASYEIARKACKRKDEVKDAKRKEDMEMTLSFSLSFSALNIEKANKCYR